MPPSVSLPQTIFVLAVSSRSSSTPSVNLFYTNDLQSLCLPSICFLFFTLSDHCLLMNAAHFVVATVLFTHWYSKEVLISLPVQSAAVIQLLQLHAK